MRQPHKGALVWGGGAATHKVAHLSSRPCSPGHTRAPSCAWAPTVCARVGVSCVRAYSRLCWCVRTSCACSHSRWHVHARGRVEHTNSRSHGHTHAHPQRCVCAEPTDTNAHARVCAHACVGKSSGSFELFETTGTRNCRRRSDLLLSLSRSSHWKLSHSLLLSSCLHLTLHVPLAPPPR